MHITALNDACDKLYIRVLNVVAAAVEQYIELTQQGNKYIDNIKE